jgi:hypothetical protein
LEILVGLDPGYRAGLSHRGSRSCLVQKEEGQQGKPTVI